MNKLCKTLALAGGVVGVTALVNHQIFKKADLLPNSRFQYQSYKWRHGTINYVVAGRAEPVLMIHDISPGASMLEWEEQIALLSKNYRVYGIDLLGFGGSDKPNMAYSAYLYATLINDFISDVVGSSVGVVAASNSAAYAIAGCALKPELYDKLLLISPTGIGTTETEVTSRSLFLRTLIDTPILGTAIYNALNSRMGIEYFLNKHVAVAGPDEIYKRYYTAHAGGVGNKYPMSAYAANLLGVKLSLMVGSLELPVHVAWGAQNKANPLVNLGALRRYNDNVGLTVFESSRTMPHREQPKKFYKLCREFLGNA